MVLTVNIEIACV